MNKLRYWGWWMLLAFPVLAQGQNTDTGWFGLSKVEIGSFHAGSYRKERPIVMVQEIVAYQFHPRLSLGIGTGLDIYPAALGFPVYLNGAYQFRVGPGQGVAQTSMGMNLRLSDVFFRSMRHSSSLGYAFSIGKRKVLLPKLGYLLNLDGYAGGSLSLVFGLDLVYGRRP